MDTGSLVDLVTSVDVGSLEAPIFNGLNGIVNAIFNVVGDVIALWPQASLEASTAASAPSAQLSARPSASNEGGENMFDLSLTYSADLVGFGSIDLVGTLAQYLNALSLNPNPPITNPV